MYLVCVVGKHLFEIKTYLVAFCIPTLIGESALNVRTKKGEDQKVVDIPILFGYILFEYFKKVSFRHIHIEYRVEPVFHT